MAELASTLCLISFPYCPVAAYFAVSSLPIRQGLGKSSLGEAPMEHCCRLRQVVALKVLQEPLGNSVLQLTDARVCCSFEHYVCVHERHIKEVPSSTILPSDRRTHSRGPADHLTVAKIYYVSVYHRKFVRRVFIYFYPLHPCVGCSLLQPLASVCPLHLRPLSFISVTSSPWIDHGRY